MTNQEIDKLATKLQTGDRIYYTGDMANGESFGTIPDRIEDPKWGLKYNVEFDDERFDGDDRTSRGVMPASFITGPGQRFKTMDQYETERAAAIAKFTALAESLK